MTRASMINAQRLFADMLLSGMAPDKITFKTVIHGWANTTPRSEEQAHRVEMHLRNMVAAGISPEFSTMLTVINCWERSSSSSYVKKADQLRTFLCAAPAKDWSSSLVSPRTPIAKQQQQPIERNDHRHNRSSLDKEQSVDLISREALQALLKTFPSE
jgi:hypothetical protein